MASNEITNKLVDYGVSGKNQNARMELCKKVIKEFSSEEIEKKPDADYWINEIVSRYALSESEAVDCLKIIVSRKLDEEVKKQNTDVKEQSADKANAQKLNGTSGYFYPRATSNPTKVQLPKFAGNINKQDGMDGLVAFCNYQRRLFGF